MTSEQLDQESFAARIEEATKEAGFEVGRREGLDLYVVLHGEPTRCNVERLYSAYQISPGRLDDIVEVHLEALLSVPPAPQPPSEEEAAESLLPMLNPSWWLEGVGRQGGEPPVHRGSDTPRRAAARPPPEP